MREINEFLNNKYENNYQTQNAYAYLRDMESIIDYDYSTKNKNAKLNLYTSNYIGFSSYEEYLGFTRYFDNHLSPLEEIGNKIYPYKESIVFGFVFMAFSILYIVLFFLSLFKKFKKIKQNLIWFFILIS